MTYAMSALIPPAMAAVYVIGCGAATRLTLKWSNDPAFLAVLFWPIALLGYIGWYGFERVYTCWRSQPIERAKSKGVYR